MSENNFSEAISNGYAFSGKSVLIGGAVFNSSPVKGLQIRIPLATLNRHGLIAGATGTGKTKSIQRLAEELSSQGVNVLLMDIKGDMSGIAMAGNENPKVRERMSMIDVEWSPKNYPAEFFTISGEKGVRMRATVSEFGPVLFSKILELNENQQGIVAIIFQYADDKKMPLLDIKDFRAVLQFLSSKEGKEELTLKYGAISPSSSGVLMRKLLELEQQGGDIFFGEKSFEVEDLLQKDPQGKGFINILRLTDIQDKPKLFSTFMLCLLAEIYNKFPEAGDNAEPKLVIFIDEAHLIFREATSALMNQLETVVKLIRSKGVGIFFCTQAPTDIPDIILSQLGTKIQHALRAFTAKDRKNIQLVSENFPLSDFYDTSDLITRLGIGEALVTALNEKGIPTPLAHTMMCAPESRMDVITPAEHAEKVASSKIAAEYNEVIDRESAYEILNKKISPSAEVQTEPEVQVDKKEAAIPMSGTLKAIANSGVAKTIFREVTRGLLGVLIGKPQRAARKSRGSIF